MQHPVSGEVQHSAFCLAWSVPRSPTDHLFPEATTQRVAIQDHKIHIWHVHTFRKDGVIAHDLELATGEAAEEFCPLLRISCAVDADGLYSSIRQKARNLLRFTHGSAEDDAICE